MNRVRLLPDHVANQIAAGEVVERPASVVKELVENALDAGAKNITVEIQAGGRALIRVTDDGSGMNRDDALMSLERHATSKIERAEDLLAISTMGFRGEAVPSIASVSRFTLTTREAGDQSGEATQITINGGKLLDVKAAGVPTGTSVEVRQLFFNLPARRKFLRAPDTEFAHIQHYFTLAALAHPQVGFVLVRDGKQLRHLPAVNDTDPMLALGERLRALHGGGLSLLSLDHRVQLNERFITEADDADAVDAAVSFRLWGFIGAPGVSRSSREDQNVFVNRRPVENRGINFALSEGYHTALMKGRYPVCCLFLEIDPAAVDVNIHPSKREVKFRDERAVRREVTNAIRQTLLAFHTQSTGAKQTPAPATQASEDAADAVPTEPLARQAPLFPLPKPSAPTTQLFSNAGRATLPRSPDQPHELGSAGASPYPSEQERAAGVSPAELVSRSADHKTDITNSAPPIAPAPVSATPSTGPVPLLAVPLRLLGVVGKLYVILESDRGLVLLDQHAAHERILFEQMLERLEHGDAPSQRLLLPETIELSARDVQFIRENLATLTRLGIGLSEFGERTFLLDALPPMVRTRDPRQFVTTLIDELKAAGAGVNALRLGEDVVAKTVCRHAVKANDALSTTELEKLIEDLRRCSMPYTCPHGRPTLIEMNFRELEKKFGRVQ
ncbi:DNA mismatch repair endonuclease MutL [bacterium]|nr:DNA mismatch repair endonuclease MutL [bacterium]